MKSMTGFGKAEYKDGNISLTVEIKTVNNRFLDLNSKFPRIFQSLEDVIRHTISKNIKRGKADVYISFEKCGESAISLKVDNNLAKAYMEASKKIAKAIGKKSDIKVSSLLKMPEIVKQTQEELDLEYVSKILEDTLTKACESLNNMRLYEGEKLKEDLLLRISTIESTVNDIKKQAPLVQQEYRDKLLERLNDILQGVNIDEARILQETAIFADKSNIDEELTRLTSHISQFRKICESEGEIGKKLDFLVQEFNREANTVCSKSNNIVVTDSALILKCEIEKIREQIQNIE